MERHIGTCLACLVVLSALFLTGCFRLNVPPTAIFTCNPLSGHSPLTVQFDASLSYDPDGEIIGYKWDFGNGETADHHYQNTASSQYVTNVTHTYVVTLTVVDDDGAEGSTELSITVSPPESPSEPEQIFHPPVWIHGRWTDEYEIAWYEFTASTIIQGTESMSLNLGELYRLAEFPVTETITDTLYSFTVLMDDISMTLEFRKLTSSSISMTMETNVGTIGPSTLYRQ